MQTDSQASKHPPIAAYSVGEFGRAFSVGRSTIFAEIAAGRLKARKVGTRTLIAHDDAVAWLNALPVRGR